MKTTERFTIHGEVSGTRLGRYTIMDSLGKGGTGHVYKVYDPDLQRILALKVIRRQLMVDSTAIQRFILEARTMARLQHPSVLPVHEIGQFDDGRVYFTMPLVQGYTLTEALHLLHTKDNAPLSQLDLINILQRVTEAVAYAHTHDIIHRDLKPDNVMLGNFGEVYVLDWGVAFALGETDGSAADTPSLLHGTSSRLTTVGQSIGTPDYMAPEQAAGHTNSISPAADIYALGGMLFEILTGRPPILGLADVEQLMSSNHPDERIPEALGDVLCRALSPDPRTRFTDARSVLYALRDWQTTETSWARSHALLRDALELEEDAKALSQEAKSRKIDAEQQLLSVFPWATTESQQASWMLEDDAQVLQERARSLYAEHVHLLRLALSTSPHSEQIRATLAEHYQQWHAESADEDDRARALQMLRRYDRGQHQTYLQGGGRLSLHSPTPNVNAHVMHWQSNQRRQVLVENNQHLNLPIKQQPFPMGSHQLMLSAPGHIDVRYPVTIYRDGDWDITAPGTTQPHPVALPRREETNADLERFVPAGWFVAGGMHGAFRCTTLPRRYWVDDFFMLRVPITNHEYMVFLEDNLTKASPTTIRDLLPTSHSIVFDGSQCSLQNNQQSQWPVVGITRDAANQYAMWRSVRDGLPWRLPDEWEWEKAARGVDRRFYPWGDEFLSKRCNMRDSNPDGPTLMPVGQFLDDCSPYDILDMAGNVEEWCSTPHQPPPPDGARIIATNPEYAPQKPSTVRGGSWDGIAQECLTLRRGVANPRWSSNRRGFRLARSYQRFTR